MDSLFFFASKILWALLQPDAMLLYALALSLVLLIWQRQRWAQWLLSATLLVLIVLAVVPLGSWLWQPLETRFAANPPLPSKVDGIIMLGGFLDPVVSDYWQQAEVSDSVERGLAFATLARQHPEATLVMSGGTGALVLPDLREADYTPMLLDMLQVDSSRVLLERESRNTSENASYSKQLVRPKAGETWVLVTSASHMPRAVGVFCRQGWPVVPWPVDHQWSPAANRLRFSLVNNWLTLNYALHEWLGLLAYHFTDRTNALFPAGCSSTQ
jgi:uncharacterized SAM-binding protein YcdF (DUF218 family)